MQLPSEHRSRRHRLIAVGALLVGMGLPLLGVLVAASTPAPSRIISLPIATTVLLTDRRTVEAWYITEGMTAEAVRATATALGTGIPTPRPPQPPPIGIIEEPNPPLPSAFFRVENAWRNYIADSLVQVFAGVEVDDLPGGEIIPPGQGVLLVFPRGGSSRLPTGSYATPTRSGPARITAASGTLLTIETTGGSQFLFDVARGQFFDLAGTPLTPPAPTITIVPTPTFPRIEPYPVPLPTEAILPAQAP